MAIEFLNSVDFNQNQLQAPAIESLATAPGTPVEGQMYFDSTGGDKTMYFWNGSEWRSMDGSAGAMNNWYLRDDDGDDKTVTNGLYVKFEAATGALGTNVTGTGTTGDPFLMTITSPNTEYSVATSSALGLIKLESDTEQSVAANAVTSTASRTYGIQLNSSNQAVVNVPWTDTNTTYSTATSTTLGLVKLGSDSTQTTAGNTVTTTASRSYKIQLNSSDQMLVNVPWTDTNTTYSMMTSSTLGLGKLFSDTQQDVAAESVSATANRTYGVQANSSDQLVINVPWTDTNTTYSAATSSALGLMKLFSDTQQDTAAESVTDTANRTYGIQFNSSDQAVVNVPWTDNNDNYIYALSVGAVSSNESTLSLVGSGGGSTTTAKFSGTTNEIEITTPSTGDGGDITIGLPSAVTITTSLAISGSGAAALDISSGKAQTAATTGSDPDATLTTKGYVDGLVSGGLTFKGTFRADSGLILSGDNNGSYIYNCPGGAGTRVAVAVGDYYVVATAGGSFYCSGDTLDIGDSIIGVSASTANNSVVGDWSIVQSDEGVVSFTNSNGGTYVAYGTTNSNATGGVTIGDVDLTAVDGTSTTGTRFLSKDNTWDVPSYTSSYTLPTATSSVLGGVKLEDDTEQTTAANAVTTTASRTYGIQMNSSDQLVVNVPWSDTTEATTWTLRDDDNDDVSVSNNKFVKFTASTGTAGTNVTGSGTTGDPYVMAITLPNDNTTYSAMTTSTLGLGKIRYAFGSTPAANSQTTTAGRTYGVTKNASDQLVVNVPWTDTTGAVTSVAAETANAYKGAYVSPTTGAVEVGVDITGQTDLSAAPASGDEILIYDTDTATNKKVSVGNLMQSAASGAYVVLNTSTTGVTQQGSPPAGTEGWVIATDTITGASDAIYVSCEIQRVSDGRTVYADVSRSSANITVNFVGSSISQGTYAAIINRVQ
jgi:hypothetical protein